MASSSLPLPLPLPLPSSPPPASPPLVPFPAHPSCKLDERELVEEEKHFQHVLRAFSSHAVHCQRILNKYRRDYESLPIEHQTILQSIGYRDKIDQAQRCSVKNQEFYDFVLAPHKMNLGGSTLSQEGASLSIKLPSTSLTQAEAENLRSLLRQVMRDWSVEGLPERKAVYGPVLQLIKDHFYDAQRGKNVLVPGAGLGRLAYEMNQEGFNCQGNEFSLFMLLVSEAFLTREMEVGSWEIHPFTLPFSNTRKGCDQFRPVPVPDISVRGAPPGTTFSMVAGDFLEVYRDEAESWDAIVTCYFIDTAKNIVEYLRLIHRLLVPGGVWINSGPLLYHFEGHHSEPSIELSVEEIRWLILTIGFLLVEESWTESTYAQNPLSMQQTVYQCWTFKAEKIR